MGVIVDSSIKKKFLKHFSDYKKGYDGLVEFVGDEVGFSIKKTYPNSDYITLLKVALIDDSEAKSNLYIDASYGKLNENSQGLVIRNSENIQLSDPVDISEVGTFAYDISSNSLTKDGKKILGVEVLNQVYEKHIKPTKRYAGALLRLRLWYWRIALKTFVRTVSDLLTYLLMVVAGI